MICVNCQKENADGAKFCVGCGKKLKRRRKLSKKIFAVLLVVAIILAAGFGVYAMFWRDFKFALDWERTKSNPIIATTAVSGKIILPPGAVNDNYQIVGLGKIATVDQSGDFSDGKIYRDGVAVLGAMPGVEGRNFGLFQVVISSNGIPENPVLMNSHTTAAALVFMTPYFMTTDLKKARQNLAMIESDSKVVDFAKVIEELFNDPGIMENPKYEQAFFAAIESTVTRISD